ncbi:helix-turn-helix transcriptional regulator [Paenibacillus sp. strain BS8-2]
MGIAKLLKEIHHTLYEQPSYYEITVSIHFRRLLLLLLPHIPDHIQARKNDFREIEVVLSYIENELTNNISARNAALLSGYSYHHFVKRFKKHIGVSFVAYVNDRRMKKAERLLLTTDLPILAIAEQTGMPKLANFYKVFRKTFGRSPSAFRKHLNEKW